MESWLPGYSENDLLYFLFRSDEYLFRDVPRGQLHVIGN